MSNIKFTKITTSIHDYCLQTTQLVARQPTDYHSFIIILNAYTVCSLMLTTHSL